MKIQHVISINTLADLKTTKGTTDCVAILAGRNSIGDGSGGLYVWENQYTTENLTFLEKIQVTGITNGQWSRLFLGTKVFPHGILVINGITKTFYSTIDYLVDATSSCSLNLTEQNTANGTAIFSKIYFNQSYCTNMPQNSNDMIFSNVKSVSADLKQTSHIFARGNQTTLGTTLLSIANLLIPGLRAVPVGTKVQFKVEGI